MNAVIVSPDIEQIKREAVIRAYNEFSGAIPLMAAGGRNHFAPRYGTDGQRLSAMGFNPIRKRMIMIEPADLDDYWNLSMFDMERGISSSFKRPISTKGVDEFIDLREFALEFSPSRPATHEPETHVAPEPDDDVFADEETDTPCCVYFVHSPANNVVKIGTTNNGQKRYQALRALSPVPTRWLGSIPGSYALEGLLHKRFASARLHGEWFAVDGALDAYLQTLFGPVWNSDEH